MKILLEAYACQPGRGSEPGVGWHAAVEAARSHQVWVVTSEENRAAIEAHPSAGSPASRIRFHYVDVPAWLRRILLCSPLSYVYAYFWPVLALRVARRLHARHRFDLVHHVTYATWRYPSRMHRLGIRFLWGPMGGGDVVPRSMFGELGWRGRLWERFRGLVQRSCTLDPIVRRAMAGASTLLAANPRTQHFIRRAFHRESRILPAAGVEAPASETRRVPCDEGRPFTVVSVGVFTPLKAFSLALDAFHRAIPDLPTGSRLLLIGDGPEKTRLARRAERLGLGTERVQFTGFVPRERVLAHLGQSDVLLFPSLRDSGGMVLLEAMASGLPVIGLDLGGPSQIITETCGFKIPVTAREPVVNELAAALTRLAGDPSLRDAMGDAGRRRVRHYSWAEKGAEMDRLYRQAVATEIGDPRDSAHPPRAQEAVLTASR